jgi:hypothetical protein
MFMPGLVCVCVCGRACAHLRAHTHLDNMLSYRIPTVFYEEDKKEI